MGISKTKLGSGILGVSAILATIGGYLSGTIDLTGAITSVIASVGAVITAFGLRDLPFVNRGSK